MHTQNNICQRFISLSYYKHIRVRCFQLSNYQYSSIVYDSSFHQIPITDGLEQSIFRGRRKSMWMKIMLSDSKATERFTCIINSAMDTSLCRRLLRSMISGVFLQPGCAGTDNFQFITGFRFFFPGFPIYPEK